MGKRRRFRLASRPTQLHGKYDAMEASVCDGRVPAHSRRSITHLLSRSDAGDATSGLVVPRFAIARREPQDPLSAGIREITGEEPRWGYRLFRTDLANADGG
jgi:hypothetical protein